MGGQDWSTVFNKTRLLLYIEKYLCYHKIDGFTSIFGMMREERSLKFKFESWPPIIGRIMKIKRENWLMSIIDEQSWLLNVMPPWGPDLENKIILFCKYIKP
jgi:hypothetical protein